MKNMDTFFILSMSGTEMVSKRNPTDLPGYHLRAEQEELGPNREAVSGSERCEPKRVHTLKSVPHAGFQAWGPFKEEGK